MYNELTEDDALIDLWEDFKNELLEKNITVSGTVSKLFENCRFKALTNTLMGTGDKNDRMIE